MINENIKDRMRKVEKTALETLDYLLETIVGSDYIEVVGGIGSISNGLIIYRVYDDGSVHVR